MSIEAVLLHVEKLLSNPILWGITAILAIALALSGRVSIAAATWLVWLACAMAIFGAYRAVIYFGADVVLRVLFVGAAAFAFATGAVILNRWFTAPRASSNPRVLAPASPEPQPSARNSDSPTGAPQTHKPHALQPSVDPIGALSQLGWTVKRDSGVLSFEVLGKPIPSMKQSAEYFRDVHEPIRLSLQQVPTIDGLECMDGISNFQQLSLGGSDLTSISQLAGFKSLRKLEISQVPLITHTDIDSAPLSGLTNLTSLVLNGSRISDLAPVANMPRLERLNIESTLIRDLSAVRSLKGLKVLDVRESRIADLSPASSLDQLEDLTVDVNQVASLRALTQLSKLNKLTVIGQTPGDLSPIGQLTHLTSLFIWGPPFMNFSFLSKLPDLATFQASGAGFGVNSQITGTEALCAGGKLKTLTLGSMQINSLMFASRCTSLTELNLASLPLVSLNELPALQNLRKLSLADIPVVEISPLLNLPNLESLYLIRVPARADVLSALERRGVKVTSP